VWCDIAGPVLAAASMRAQLGLFEAAGGVLERARVQAVQPAPGGVRIDLEDGTPRHADVAVLAPGPGARGLLDGLGVPLALRPRLEQVVHFGDPADPAATDGFPCLVDRPHRADDGSDVPNLYAMPTPGRGYKVGIDRPLRDLVEGDVDRTPSETTTAEITGIVRRDLTGIRPEVLDAQVCSWTESPDGRFVLDTLPGGIVLACGDSGEGFKFSALMGLVLADLAEGRAPDTEVAAFSLARFDTVP
jgi:sarcosine oxidase